MKITKQKNRQPFVSVVMPLFNAEKYVSDAINSILAQNYQNLEFIIVDDRSTDGSYKIALDYAKCDKRIRLFRNKKNEGVSVTTKRAIDRARGEFIARMDADDIAIPTRISKQVEYLKKHTGTVAVGGQCILIDKESNVIGEKQFPLKFEDIYKYSFRFVPVQQPTLMIAKKRLPVNFEFYVDGMNTAEEVELFFKLFQHGKVENLKDTLLFYRIHDKNTSFANIKQTFLLTLISRIKAVYKHNYKPTIIGVFFTLIQAAIVLSLPSRLTLFLYRNIRKTLPVRAVFSFHQNQAVLSTAQVK